MTGVNCKEHNFFLFCLFVFYLFIIFFFAFHLPSFCLPFYFSLAYAVFSPLQSIAVFLPGPQIKNWKSEMW